MHTSPDLDSILNDQFGRLQDKEPQVHSKIRASKHTSKTIRNYLEKRSEIEAKYISEITHLCDAFAPKIDESDTISKVWIQLRQNDKLQCDQRRRYISNLGKQQQLFADSYIEHKSAENAMAKQMETNKKILSHSQRKLDGVISDMESVQNELKKMDERRRNEQRDRFNDKELKRFKELRIKLAHFESVKMEKSSHHHNTQSAQRKAMAQNIKIFLKQQIHHSKAIKRSLFDLETHQSELYINCDQINKKKLAHISEINPVEDVLDWISSIHAHANHNAPSAPQHSDHTTTQSATPWITIEESATSTSASTNCKAARRRSASVDSISVHATQNHNNDKDLLHSPLIEGYWKGMAPSLATVDESSNHTAVFDMDIDHETLLSETAHDIKDFKSSYSIKSGYGVYCEMDQLFPCNLSYKQLDTFCIHASEWNKLYFEFILLASDCFRNVSPAINHLWQVLIPQTLRLSKAEVKRLTHCMEMESMEMELNMNHYVSLISYKTRFEFKNDDEYGAWLRRQLTLIVAAIAWSMCQHYKSQWRLSQDQRMLSYSQIISSLNHQCATIMAHPSDHPNKELQLFIQNIECLMEQLSEYKDMKTPSLPNLNQTQSISALNASEEDFESQSEIEYLSDDEEEEEGREDEEADNKQDATLSFKTPSKDTQRHKYNIRFPKQISRFVLWQLMKLLMTETRDNNANRNRKRKSMDLSEALEIKIQDAEEGEYHGAQMEESKLMIHSKILSTKGTDGAIDYDELCIIPGTIEPHQSDTVRVIRGEYRQFLDSFESAYCDLLRLNPYIVYVFMARLTVDVCLDHIDFDCDGISLLESLMSVPLESPLSTAAASSPHIIHTTMHHMEDQDEADENKPKRSTKYHINKKWGKLKRRISISSKSSSKDGDEASAESTQKQPKKKKKKFRPKKLARRLSINIHKGSKSSEEEKEHEPPRTVGAQNLMMSIDRPRCESMKHLLKRMWFNIYECIKENHSSKSGISARDAEDADARICHRIIQWILGHLQNWLFSYQSYPISITKDYFHLFIAGQSLITSSISHAVRSIEYILVAATHIKYDAIYDSIMDIRFKKARWPKSDTVSVSMDRTMFNVNEWEMFVEALVNWMDIESNNNQSVFEQYHIHPKIGQFILFTLCQRFSTDFKHYIFNTDPFELQSRPRSVSVSYPKEIEKQCEAITAFMDPRLVTLCDIARHFENNMLLNKNLLTMAHDSLYHKISPSANYIALSQLGELLESQANQLLQWTKSLLLGEDWIGMDDDQPFSQSVIHLFNALNAFTDNFFAATRKLQIRTILSNHKLYRAAADNGNKWNVSKLRDSLIGIIGSCVNYYSDHIVSISGKLEDVIPESTDIMCLNARNLQKSDNFNLKEIYRKSKKSLLKTQENTGTTNTNDTRAYNHKAPPTQYHLDEQKPEILCTRFESIGKAIVLCKSLNHKIKTIWYETGASESGSGSEPVYAWLNGSIDNLCKTVDHLGNLLSFYALFVELRVDIIHNLYSSKPAIASASEDINNSNAHNASKSNYNMKGGGKIVENAISLNLWNKMGSFFQETLSKNTSLDGFNCIIGKTLGLYLLSIRWIVLHSNKNRKFDVGDHRIIQSDMIPLIKFFATYLSNECIGEIRLLSTIDTIIDLMSKSTETLIDCCARAQYSLQLIQKPFVISNSKKYYCCTPQPHSISSKDEDRDVDVLSIIDSIHNPFPNRNNHLFHPCNYKSVLSLLPYVITKEKDVILHVLVRRIQRNAQKYVAQELQIIAENHANNTNNIKNDTNTNSDSDSFVSF